MNAEEGKKGILHLSCRLKTGGAAQVMNSLIDAPGSFRHFVAYGYGARGLSEQNAEPDKEFYLSSPWRAGLNMLSFRVLGRELVSPTRDGVRLLHDLFRKVSIVHVHVLHSYYLPLHLFEHLSRKYNVKIIATTHDFWWITGRCAFTNECDRWKSGCGACLTLKNYPPVLFDRSRIGWIRRRRMIQKLGNGLCLVCPSAFVHEIHKVALPEVRSRLIRNGVDNAFHFKRESYSQSPDLQKLRVVAISADLRDEEKVDSRIVKALAASPHFEVRCVGKHGEHLAPAIWMGEIRDRRKLASLLQESDILLFVSQKDTSGLVLMEALCCGMLIAGRTSAAVEEQLSLIKEELIPLQRLLDLSSADECSIRIRLSEERRVNRSSVSIEKFGVDEMIRQYQTLYTELAEENIFKSS